jgi:ribosomal protein S27AE
MPTSPDRLSAATVLAEAQAALRAWATAHPQATLYEMEVATERHLARVRAALLGEVVATTSAPSARPTCPDCGAPMQQAGQQERTIALPHDETLSVRGPRYRCPACGAGLFPPR